ncbi:MAG: hypothetical protein ACRD2L_26510 [Terriglobia bacterium]
MNELRKDLDYQGYWQSLPWSIATGFSVRCVVLLEDDIGAGAAVGLHPCPVSLRRDMSQYE